MNYFFKYLSINSLTKKLYSTSDEFDSSASNKHNGGNNTHQKLSPSPDPKVTTNDSYSPSLYVTPLYFFLGK